jgi:hypothetical protein
MLGRELTVTSEINKVVATSPPSTILIYMLAPEKLAGWNFINTFNHTLMKEEYLSLPESAAGIPQKRAITRRLSESIPTSLLKDTRRTARSMMQ